MANEEHLDILKQGGEVWNRWREENPDVRPNLSQANLSRAYLSEVNLGAVDLRQADLRAAELMEGYLRGADLREADLSEANLGRAYLGGANLGGADLGGANLHRADLGGANLHRANLRRANLRQADLRAVDFTEATVGDTLFGDLDLSLVEGLQTVRHRGPSTVGIDTIYRSGGKIPETFLRGCGVPDNFIAYMGLLTGKAFEYYSCFISYSTQDDAFAQRLHNDLQSKGVRCWFAPKDMKIGDKIRDRIEESIRRHDKLMIVLSEHSINSAWVEKEVETAFEEERRRNTRVLLPIRLDEAVMRTNQAWAADIRRTRHIGDFTEWEHYPSYQKAFARLLRDLKASGA
jgi:hypothetical protein